MSIFNEKQRKAMTDGEYICSKSTRIYIRPERKFWVLPRMSPKKKIKNAIS